MDFQLRMPDVKFCTLILPVITLRGMKLTPMFSQHSIPDVLKL